MPTIELPHNWKARDYQIPCWRALASGIKRAVPVWPRRHGKDDISLHWTASEAFIRAGNYWHMLPQSNQARKGIWDAVNPHTGKPRISEAFPDEIIASKRDSDMFIRFKNGSTWQVGGSDNYMALLGSPPIGVVLSEYAYGDPNAWGALRPILLENGGWAIFPSTPGGRNHFHGLYKMALDDPLWFAERLTYKDCGVFTDAQIEQERKEIAAERGDDEADAIISQWYMCSFDAPLPGSFYGRILNKSEEEGRIAVVPHQPGSPVITAWDIGVSDDTTIWFVQQNRFGAVNVVDYYHNTGLGADHYAQIVKEKEYTYDGHILPPDAEDREWGNKAMTPIQTLKGLNIGPLKVLTQDQRGSRAAGINAVRMLLPLCAFDAVKCADGISALRNYRREWDDKRMMYSTNPVHDWASHGSDAMRYLAIGLPLVKPQSSKTRPKYATR